MSAGWSWFVGILVAINVVGALWLLWATSRRRPGDQEPGEETTGHVWDGDLREYNNPLPRWWLWLFYGTVAWGIGYMVVYPSLGNWGGTAGWSQQSQWQAQVDAAERRAAPVFARFEGMDLAALQADEEARKIGANLYANHCATCHGSDARGAKGFPNLTDGDWLYGGDPETVLATLRHGRQGVMPGWGEALGQRGVEETTAYVITLSGREAPAALAEAGAAHFAMYCAACHGVDGRGQQALGAPNLTDDIWLYGGTAEEIRYGIVNGRNNQMPAQLELLGEQRLRLLAAHVLALAAPAADISPPPEGEVIAHALR